MKKTTQTDLKFHSNVSDIFYSQYISQYVYILFWINNGLDKELGATYVSWVVLGHNELI